MRPEDFDSFSEVVAGFAELRGKQLSAAAIKLYWGAMQDWSIEDFRAAAHRLLTTTQFMPTPKDFEDLRRAAAPTTGEAWARVLQHTKGAYRDGSGLDDGGPIDTAVQGLGGYKAIAMYDSGYLGVLERRFSERLAETKDALETREALPNLTAGQKALTHVA